MHFIPRCAFLCSVLSLCSSLFFCNVTFDGNQTVYSVSSKPNQSDVPWGCEYYWTNSTGHVLANHESKGEGVTLNRIDRLSLSKCIDPVLYVRLCPPEKGEDFSVTCNISCRPNPASQADEDEGTEPTEPTEPPGVSSSANPASQAVEGPGPTGVPDKSHTVSRNVVFLPPPPPVAVVVVLVVLGLGLLGLAVCLIIRFKDKISRKCSSFSASCKSTAVKYSAAKYSAAENSAAEPPAAAAATE